MQPLIAFVTTSLDGLFCRLGWRHELGAQVRSGMAGGSFRATRARAGPLLFGRVTYDLMIRYWPTPMAKQQNPAVADGMNSAPKIVVSRTLKEATCRTRSCSKAIWPGKFTS